MATRRRKAEAPPPASETGEAAQPRDDSPHRRDDEAAGSDEPASQRDETPVEPLQGESTGLAIFGEVERGMAALRQEFKGRAYELTTDVALKAAKSDMRRLVSTRTAVERIRLDANRVDRASIEERIKRRDEAAALLTTELKALEDPIRQQIEAEEARREEARAARMKAEQDRIEGIRGRIDMMRRAGERTHRLPPADLEQRIRMLEGIAIDESFEELAAEAGRTKAEALETLREVLQAAQAAAKATEEQQAREAELERLRAQQRQREEAEAEQRRKAEEAHRKALEEQRAAMEAEQARIREAEEAQRRRTSAIAAIRAVPAEVDDVGDIDAARAALARLEAMRLDPDIFGDMIETADIVREGAAAKVRRWIEAAEAQAREEAERRRQAAERAAQEEAERAAIAAEANRAALRLERMREHVAELVDLLRAIRIEVDLPRPLAGRTDALLQRIDAEPAVPAAAGAT